MIVVAVEILTNAQRGARNRRGGVDYELTVSKHLAEKAGAVMVRAAGSRGKGKIDLVAFMPDARILLIQCKKADPKIGPAEWNTVYEVAQRNPTLWRETGVPMVVPLIATKGQRGKGPDFYRLLAERVPNSRVWPWTMYDVIHGTDIEIRSRAA